MAYATPADVEKILPEEDELPEEDSRGWNNLTTALEEATDLVEGYLQRRYSGAPDPDDPTVPGDVPGAVRRVVARVALRGFLEDPTNPGAESEVNLMGPFSHTVNWSKEAQDRSAYLTRGEETRLEPYVLASSSAATHLPMYQFPRTQ